MASQVERNYFGSRHGKNACDGKSAMIKCTVTQARRVTIQTALNFFAFCKTHLVKPDQVNDACSHYRRDFIFVKSEEIDRKKEKDELYTIKGTRGFHNVKSTGHLKLKVQPLSCYCHGCEAGTMCYNETHVEPWKDIKIRVKHRVICI